MKPRIELHDDSEVKNINTTQISILSNNRDTLGLLILSLLVIVLLVVLWEERRKAQ